MITTRLLTATVDYLDLQKRPLDTGREQEAVYAGPLGLPNEDIGSRDGCDR